MMNDIKPLLHEHHLLFDEYNKQEASCCYKCNQQIDFDWAFSCKTCNFWLHQSCALKELPTKILHPLHSDHQLRLSFEEYLLFVCHKCFNLTRGWAYRCTQSPRCEFYLDLICAFSTFSINDIDQTPKEESQIRSSKRVLHFSHAHELNLFNYRKVGKDDYSCFWCGKLILAGISYGCLGSLSGISYGYISVGCKVFFHESCLINMPTLISKQYFHPSHPLLLQPVSNFIKCSACTERIVPGSSPENYYAYTCKKCKFYLHIGCAAFQPSIKHELHEHSLTYFCVKPSEDFLQCKICYKKIRDGFFQIAFYRCVQCDFNLHFDCTQIPSSTKHKYHRHELKFMNSFIEDESIEYFCDICEKERKPKDHVYCCKTCNYIAHIGCALNKPIDVEYDHGWTSSNLVDGKVTIRRAMEQDETKHRSAKFWTLLDQIDHVDHEHPLSFNEVIEQNQNLLCKACCLKIFDQAYACQSCNYCMHKGCIQLPFEVLEPLHPQHSLKLFTFLPRGSLLRCYECKSCSDEGFAYLCMLCGFLLHVKCTYSSSMPTYDQGLRLKEIESQRSEMCPFDQGHKLYFGNYASNLRYYDQCSFCQESLIGPSYECLSCPYKVHEGCLWCSREMQLQFHPEHPLHTCIVLFVICLLCQNRIERMISYSCLQCGLYLHPSCARILERVIKSKSHLHNNVHNVHYAGPEWGRVLHRFGGNCNKCEGRMDPDALAVYICRECNTWLHFRCAQIPEQIKSKYHIHTLALKCNLSEDGSVECYCDICEEKRYPKDHTYYCIECEGLFVAHMDCVLTSVEEIGAVEEILKFGPIHRRASEVSYSARVPFSARPGKSTRVPFSARMNKQKRFYDCFDM